MIRLNNDNNNSNNFFRYRLIMNVYRRVVLVIFRVQSVETKVEMPMKAAVIYTTENKRTTC